MSRRFTAEVILEALSYALYQTINSQVEVTRTIETDDDLQLQIAELVEAIEDCKVNWGIDDVMMEGIDWFTAVSTQIPKK